MRIGIIGTKWGRMHIGAFRAAGAEVVALCGKDAEGTRAVAQREQIGFSTSEVKALCAEVDVVVVASPDGLHREHVETALSAGKHVLWEKPLATRFADAVAMVAASEAKPELRAAVSFPYRQLPPIRGFQAWLAGRQVEEVNLTLRPGFIATLEGSGDFGGASHPIDAMLWLTGRRPERVQATIRSGCVALQVSLEDGVRFTMTHRPTVEPGIHGSWAVRGPDFEAGFFAGFQPELGGWRVSAPRAYLGGGWVDVEPGLDPRPDQREPWAQSHVVGARAFLEGETQRLASFRDGAQVQAVLEAAAASNASGRWEPVLQVR